LALENERRGRGVNFGSADFDPARPAFQAEAGRTGGSELGSDLLAKRGLELFPAKQEQWAVMDMDSGWHGVSRQRLR
jgi:hypothetical protein